MNGMDDNEDETDLYDDDFESLSESALQELEQQAIRSTQAQQKAQNTTTKQAHVPSKLASLPQGRLQAQARFNPRPPHLNSSLRRDSTGFQYEDDSFELVGEEGVPTPAEEYDVYHVNQVRPSEASQREQWRQQRYGHAYTGDTHRPVSRALQGNDGQSPYTDTAVRLDRNHASPDRMLLDNSQHNQVSLIPEDAGDGFRSRIDDLIRERDVLVKDLQRTQDTVTMQKGEISIIRANFDKEKKILDRQIDALKKAMEDESAKHNAAISAMMEKNNNLTTRYQFLQQEHNQEVQEARSLKQRMKEKPPAEKDAGGAATPRRGMASSLRDGFDDDDVMMLSPSKSARRSKPTTPTAANKRKRKADVPSPVKPLVLRPTAADPPHMPPPVAPEPALSEERLIPIIRKDKQTSRHLQFLQSILDYRVKGTKEPLFEVMVNFSLPSSTKTFATILLEGTAHLEGARIPSDMLQLFIDLWSKSIKAEYYKPIPLLIEVVSHIIDVDLEAIDSGIVNSLVPLLQSTVTINAEKRVKHSPVNHSTFGKFRQTPQSVLNHDVDGTACLEVMLTMAYIISDETDLLSLFWRLIQPEFVLMMLNAWQPVSDITLMLRLLETSIFSDTFGSICVDDQQKQIEQHIMNRICYLLWETPKVDEGLPANTTASICQLRLRIMDLLLQVTTIPSTYSQDDQTHHGSLLVADHPSAIARIVRSLYDEVSAMYDLTPSHALHAAIVNKGVQLLFHVLEVHGSQINLQEKLSVINGGVHKHRVVLTRLAFSEGFYVDRLITDDTVAMATSMLEESVTPDEADDLIEAFPGFRGRGRVEEGE
ncbi:hypothetical protein PV08_06665 [Exophiala spinifera]|uniref:DNA repair protein Rad26 n=1 Tax=Exophiala spinifera TaxID=91928 RepID=A0A0D2BRL3_9EURO|nr:uncharacterized protein PV08_06665 [Exophiala spinifera]KIW13884.1 hypothetical protein PV08_06665 [Exophiala spinifera]